MGYLRCKFEFITLSPLLRYHMEYVAHEHCVIENCTSIYHGLLRNWHVISVEKRDTLFGYVWQCFPFSNSKHVLQWIICGSGMEFSILHEALFPYTSVRKIRATHRELRSPVLFCHGHCLYCCKTKTRIQAAPCTFGVPRYIFCMSPMDVDITDQKVQRDVVPKRSLKSTTAWTWGPQRFAMRAHWASSEKMVAGVGCRTFDFVDSPTSPRILVPAQSDTHRCGL